MFTYSVAAHRLKELLVVHKIKHVRKNVRAQQSKITRITVSQHAVVKIKPEGFISNELFLLN